MRRLFLLALPLVSAGCVAAYGGVDGGYGDYHYHDIRKPHGRSRGEGVLQVTAEACMASTGHSDSLAELPATQRDPRYKRCMLAHGWKFYAYTPPAAQPYRQQTDETTSIPDTTPTHDTDADTAAASQAATDAANAQTLQNSIDTSNAIQEGAMVGR